MEKNDQIYRFSNPTAISLSDKKQFIFQQTFIFNKNATIFVIGPTKKFS